MEILDRFREIVSGRDAVVIECGCNNGDHTILMRDIGVAVAKSYRHIAIEPDPRAFSKAKEWASSAEVKLIEAAVAEKPGRVNLWLSSGSNAGAEFTGSSSINRPTGVAEWYEGIRFDKQIDVAAISLDGLFETMQLDHVDFIWADIQGGEKGMLQGGQKLCLPRTRYLYTEYSNGGLYEDDANLEDIKSLMPGWVIGKDFGGDVLMENQCVKEGELR